MSLLLSSTRSCSDAFVALELLTSGYPAFGSLTAFSFARFVPSPKTLPSSPAGFPPSHSRPRGSRAITRAPRTPFPSLPPVSTAHAASMGFRPDLRSCAFHLSTRDALSRGRRRLVAHVPDSTNAAENAVATLRSCFHAVADAFARGLRLLQPVLTARHSSPNVDSTVSLPSSHAAPAPFTVRHLAVRSKARPARSPWLSPPWSRASGPAWLRRSGGDPGLLRPMSASHDSFCKERAPPLSRSTPRRISTRPGSYRFTPMSSLRRASRFHGALPLRFRRVLSDTPSRVRWRTSDASSSSHPPHRGLCLSRAPAPVDERAPTERMSIESARRPTSLERFAVFGSNDPSIQAFSAVPVKDFGFDHARSASHPSRCRGRRIVPGPRSPPRLSSFRTRPSRDGSSERPSFTSSSRLLRAARLRWSSAGCRAVFQPTLGARPSCLGPRASTDRAAPEGSTLPPDARAATSHAPASPEGYADPSGPRGGTVPHRGTARRW